MIKGIRFNNFNHCRYNPNIRNDLQIIKKNILRVYLEKVGGFDPRDWAPQHVDRTFGSNLCLLCQF